MNKQEVEFKKVVDEMSKIDELDFKRQLTLLKEIKEKMRSPDFKELWFKEESDEFEEAIKNIVPLALYFKGDEKAKGIDGKPCGIGLFYSELSDGKKKEFLEAANEWLRILDAKE